MAKTSVGRSVAKPVGEPGYLGRRRLAGCARLSALNSALVQVVGG